MEADHEDALARLEAAVAECNSHIMGASSDISNRIAQLHEQISAFALGQRDRLVALTQARGEAETLKETIAELKDRLQAERAQAEMQAENLRQKEAQTEDLRQKYETASTDVANKLSEALRDRDEAHMAALTQARAETAALSKTIAELKNRLQGERSQAEVQVENLRQKYETASTDMANKLREALRDRDEAHQEIVSLRTEIELLRRANAAVSLPAKREPNDPADSDSVPVHDPDGHKRRIGEILVELGAITVADRDEALEEQALGPHRRLGMILVEKNLVTEELIARIVARQLELPFVRLTQDVMNPLVARIITVQTATQHMCVPISVSPTSVVLAMANPFDLVGIDDVELATGRHVEPAVTISSDVTSAIPVLYDT